MRTKQKWNLLNGNSGKAILFFAIPIIIANLFQQFYNMVDAIVVSNYVGEDALAAVGASYAIANVFIAVAIGGSIGSAIVISQYWGAKEYRNVKSGIFTILVNFAVLGSVLGMIGFTMSGRFLTALNTPSNILDDAKTYLDIYFWGLPFLFLYNAEAAVLNSLGDSKTPLKLLIFSSVLNVILDIIFVAGLHQGIKGVAIATLIAQGISAIITLIILLYKIQTFEKGKVKWYSCRIAFRMLKVAVPSVLQQSIVYIGMLFVQSVVNGFGSAVLAGYSAGMRFESVFVVPMIAIGNAMSTFTAQNIGAGQIKRVKTGYRSSYRLIFCMGVITLVVLQLFGKTFLKAFLDANSESAAFETGLRYLEFLSFFYIFIGLKATTDGVLRGAGDVMVFTAANLINLTIRVWFAFQFTPILGVQAVWIAVPLGWVSNYIISFLWYLTGKWSKKRLISI